MANAEHLQMIQAVVERMGRNSFLLKSWTVTLVAALIGLAAEKTSSDFAIIAAAVSLIFGLLDAYYLALERKYRALYNCAIAPDSKVSEWSLTTGKVSAEDLCSALFSPTVLPLHGSAFACAVAVAIIA
jgi:general stress protein CsbA